MTPGASAEFLPNAPAYAKEEFLLTFALDQRHFPIWTVNVCKCFSDQGGMKAADIFWSQTLSAAHDACNMVSKGSLMIHVLKGKDTALIHPNKALAC